MSALEFTMREATGKRLVRAGLAASVGCLVLWFLSVVLETRLIFGFGFLSMSHGTYWLASWFPKWTALILEIDTREWEWVDLTGYGVRFWIDFTPSPWIVMVPAWFVFLLAALPTILLRYLARRPSAHPHCRCGYDLTGNVTGTCPECGSSALTNSTGASHNAEQ